MRKKPRKFNYIYIDFEDGTGVYQCTDCGAYSTESKKLIKHYANCKPDIINEKEIECSECGKKIPVSEAHFHGKHPLCSRICLYRFKWLAE